MDYGPLDKTLYEKLLSCLPYGLMIIDYTGNVLFANKTACELTGLSDDELAKSSFNSLWGLFPGKTEEPKNYKFTFRSGKISYHEIIVSALDEKRFSVIFKEISPDNIKDAKFNEKDPLSKGMEQLKESSKWADLESGLNLDTEKFFHYLSFVGSMVVVIDCNGDVVYINGKGCRLLGIDKDNIVGKNWVNNFIPVENRKEIDDVLQRVFKLPDDSLYNYENPILCSNGKIRIINWSNTIIRNKDGSFGGALSSGEDITDIKLSEQKIKESEQRLKKAESLLMMGHWEMDLKTNTYVSSDGFFRLMGYEPGEYSANLSNFLSEVHPDDYIAVKNIIDESHKKQEGYSAEFRIIRKDGAIRYIKAESIFLKDMYGNATKAFGVVIDITQIEENQRKLAETQKTLSRAEEIADIGSWVMDIESGIYVCSDGFCKICGLEQDNFVPTFETMGMVTHPDDRQRVNKLIKESIASGKNFNFENRVVRPDGTIRHIRSKGTYLKDKNNKPIKSIGVLLDITEFKKKEEELIQNKRFLQDAEQIANMGNWTIDLLTGERHCSEGFCTVCGLDFETFIPTFESMNDSVYAEDREMALNLLLASRKTGSSFSFEHRIIRPDGKIRHVRSRGTYLLDKLNNPVMEIGTILDITDYREKEEKLEESERRLREAELISGTGHWEWDILTDEHFTSEGLRKIIGHETLSSIQGEENSYLVFGDEDRKKIRKIIDNALSTGTPYSYEAWVIRPDGEHRFVEVRGLPIKDANGTVIKTQGTFTDITQKKEFQEKILQNEIRFNKAEETAQIGNWERDLKTGLYVSSNGIYKILGLNPAQSLHTFDEQISLVHPDDVSHIKKTIESAIQKGIDYSLEHRIVRPSGEVRYIKTNATMVRDSSGNPIKISGLVIDVTDSKKQELEKQAMEAQLRNQQKLESIGILAGGVAHEINNPINGIMNYSQLILDAKSDNDEIRSYADEIINESERISKIVRNLLHFSRQEQISYSPHDIIFILNQTLSLINTIIKKDNISIVTDFQEFLPKVNCNSQQIQQVIMNLLTNARDALNDKYPGQNDDKIILIKADSFINNNTTWVGITVEDHGSGIPEKIRDYIFNPFFTTKEQGKGTGLGLSISFGIIQDHKGKISFKTKTNEYTKFIIELPVVE